MHIAMSILGFTLFWLVLGTGYFALRARRFAGEPQRAVVRRAIALYAEEGKRLVARSRGAARRSRYDVIGSDGRVGPAGLTYFQLEVQVEQASVERYTCP